MQYVDWLSGLPSFMCPHYTIEDLVRDAGSWTKLDMQACYQDASAPRPGPCPGAITNCIAQLQTH
jgi:hypothetical protein